MPNFVVYTVLTGDSEERLNNPFPEDALGFDRICFTDDMTIDPNGWTLVHLDTQYLDASRAAKLPKILPHRYLQEYQWSLYIDNTVKFKRSPSEIFLKHTLVGKDYWCTPHPWRDCIYDEAEELIKYGFDDEVRIREQMDFYRKAGYPPNNGLAACTVLLRRHNSSHIIDFHEIWFHHVLRFSRRDQLSFQFLTRQLDFNFFLFDLNLQENEYWSWPGFSTKRLPRDFDEDTYIWLNPHVSTSNQSPAKHYLTEGFGKSLNYATVKWELTRLANKYKTDKGNYYYNTHNYATVYEKYFQPIRELPLRILEIGLLRHDVQARNPGGPYDQIPSLQMWREYFPNAEVIGFDIQDFSIAPKMPNVRIIQGDMENKADLLEITKSGNFDIIIDDASHASHHQQIVLSVLFPFLKEGGYYFIEDLDYQPSQLERPNIIKTKYLLKLLKLGIFQSTPYVSTKQLASLYINSKIDFYDSFDVNFSRTSDSLVVIQKITGNNNFLANYRLGRGGRLLFQMVKSPLRKWLADLEKIL